MSQLTSSVLAAVVALTAASCGRDPPVAPQQAAPARLVPPLCDAQAGEWLRIESGRNAQLFRVVDAGDYYVDVETTTYQDEAPIGTPQRQRWPRNSFGLPQDECVIRAIDADRIEVGDRWYDCWRIFVTSRSGQEKFLWISDEVPVHGLLKVAGIRKAVADEAHAAKLTESGFKPK
jgi:hypothetical protein